MLQNIFPSDLVGELCGDEGGGDDHSVKSDASFDERFGDRSYRWDG